MHPPFAMGTIGGAVFPTGQAEASTRANSLGWYKPNSVRLRKPTRPNTSLEAWLLALRTDRFEGNLILLPLSCSSSFIFFPRCLRLLLRRLPQLAHHNNSSFPTINLINSSTISGIFKKYSMLIKRNWETFTVNFGG